MSQSKEMLEPTVSREAPRQVLRSVLVMTDRSLCYWQVSWVLSLRLWLWSKLVVSSPKTEERTDGLKNRQ